MAHVCYVKQDIYFAAQDVLLAVQADAREYVTNNQKKVLLGGSMNGYIPDRDEYADVIDGVCNSINTSCTEIVIAVAGGDG